MNKQLRFNGMRFTIDNLLGLARKIPINRWGFFKEDRKIRKMWL